MPGNKQAMYKRDTESSFLPSKLCIQNCTRCIRGWNCLRIDSKDKLQRTRVSTCLSIKCLCMRDIKSSMSLSKSDSWDRS